MPQKPLRVVHFHRKPGIACYSIERLFLDIRNAMPSDINVAVHESRFYSRGLWRRFFNIIEASRHQGDINHITGDVHYLAFLLNPRKTVLTIHDCGSMESSTGIKRWLLWLFWFWLPVRCVGAVTVISESSKRELLKYVDCPPEKIHIIYNCIPDWFVPSRSVFNPSCPRILHIGSTQNKNIERIAQALVGIQCHWVVIGHLSDEKRAFIESCGIDYENLSGLTDKALLEQYQLADMLVFASTYEGFGLPIAEANAVGRPVVTSNLYSMPEVAGDAACLVDPYDVDSIRAGIVRVIEDQQYREHLVEAGFQNAKRFWSATIAGQYASVYRQMASAG